MKTAIILYEVEQLASVDALLTRYMEGGEVPRIVSLDAEIDHVLERRGMPFISGATLQNRSEAAAFLRADTLTREIFESGVLSFLSYRNVSLLEPLRFSVHLYFIRLLTYISIVAQAVGEMKNVERLIVSSPTEVIFDTSGFLAEHESFAVVEAARRVAESRGLLFESIQSAPAALRLGNKFQKIWFTAKRAAFGAGITLLNSVMSLRPRRPIRILASDYWRNIAPVLKSMPDAELIMIDRTEAFKAGLKNIWRHKARFAHIESFLSRKDRQGAVRYARECQEQWHALSIKEWLPANTSFCGVELALVCERIMVRLIERAVPRVARDIAGAYALYASLAPDMVWLRVSVSSQIHFSILPLVAKELGIPSLEPQHGIDYSGPGSATRRHAAQYFALYGPLVCKEFATQGFAQEHLLAAGSPRFDSYTHVVREPLAASGAVRVLSTIPNVNPFERFGTYSVEEHFAALGSALAALPKIHLTVTSRNENRAGFLHEAMKRGLQGVSYEFAGTAPLPKLFATADVFVCGYSTVVYESLLHGLPTIVIAFAPQERLMSEYSFVEFEKAGALAIARTPQELKDIFQRLTPGERARMGAAGQKFMAENFSFDGKASARIAGFIRARV